MITYHIIGLAMSNSSSGEKERLEKRTKKNAEKKEREGDDKKNELTE